MSPSARRAWAAAATFLLAAAVSVVTGVLTQTWSAAWWAALAVLVVVGGGLQAWAALADRPARSQRVSGTVVGGSVEQRLRGDGDQSVTDTRIRGGLAQHQDDGADGS
ncbi:hypothetical protein ABZ705_26900 [Streptomyces sp. NPDC006984]|uniref:hypothetical protein n=1 Tax=Streptomyces sp. NPDC006984 TaxID=3155463 RepID=UPI0033EE7F36